MNIAPDKLDTFLSAYSKTISIEGSMECQNGKEMNVADILEDTKTDVSATAEAENLKRDLETVTATLKEREQDVIKMPVSYKLYCKGHEVYYHNQLSADVSFTKYAPTKRVKGYLSDEVMPTTLKWYGATPRTTNTDSYNKSYSHAQIVIPSSSSSDYYNYSSLEVTKCIGCIGSKSIDYIEEGTEPLDIMYSPLGYSDLNITYSTYNFYNLIKNYDKFLITYK